MFVLQAAMVKEGGGIAAAVGHYDRMCRAVGAPTAAIFEGPPAQALRRQGVDVIDAPAALGSPFSALPVLGALRAAIYQRTSDADLIVIVHSDKALPALKRLLPRARFVTPCHSDKFKHKGGADLVVSLNPVQHELALAALPRAHVAMLGNPFVPPPPPPLPVGDAVRFNYVARFTPTKDPMTLMRAASLAGVRGLEVRFFGAGPMEIELLAAADSTPVAASFPGWVEAPFDGFHDRDVLVLPSHWEGLPYLLQEALHRGVPIIAADNPGNRAALEDGAYGDLFPVGDAETLAAAMREALDDLDALRAKAEKGRAGLDRRYGAAAFWRGLQRELEASAR